MTNLFWIIFSNLLMSLISFVGLATSFLKEETLKKIIFPLVAFSAGSLLAGAFLHMIPEALEAGGEVTTVFIWVLFGFALFFLFEQFIHWHHCHKMPSEHKHPVTYLILFADAIHNFIDGLAIGAAFMADFRLGWVTWVATASHEIPQELGDYGILIHGGWKAKRALLFNFFSGLTAILGGLFAYFLSTKISVLFLLPFAAGNFIYIASSDLIPEIKMQECLSRNLYHFSFFVLGILFLAFIKLFF